MEKIDYSKFVKGKPLCSGSKREQDILKLITTMYDIVHNTGCSLYQIQLRSLAQSLGLNSHPSMDDIAASMPTDKPTIQDAIKIHENELNRRRKNDAKKINAVVPDCETDMRIVELTDILNARDLQIDNLNKRVDELEKQCTAYKNMAINDPRADKYEEILVKIFNVFDNSLGSFNTFRAKFEEVKSSKK